MWLLAVNPETRYLQVDLILQAHYRAHKEELLATVEYVIQGKAAIGGTPFGPDGEGAPSEGICLVLRQLLPNFQAAVERS